MRIYPILRRGYVRNIISILPFIGILKYRGNYSTVDDLFFQLMILLNDTLHYVSSQFGCFLGVPQFLRSIFTIFKTLADLFVLLDVNSVHLCA